VATELILETRPSLLVTEFMRV